MQMRPTTITERNKLKEIRPKTGKNPNLVT